MNPARTKELALAMTAFPSVTDSDGETRFAFFLRDLLAGWPYFMAHPELLKLVRTRDDAFERYVVAACVRTPATVAGPVPERAVILTGHYDVVSVAAYGALAQLAFDPPALAQSLSEALERESGQAADRGERLGKTASRALDDLRSGEFLPGRGLLDMKAGLAAGLAFLEDSAAAALSGGSGANGALVFLAVPDEEGSSHGMLSAILDLPGILSDWGVEPVAAVNLDAAVDQGDGSEGRAVFMGSVGKLHPFSLFVGCPTHAGAPFDGINPALLAAEYAKGIECAVDLFDQPGGTASALRDGDSPPPPTILYYRELRDRYDVTTPDSVFVSANVLTHRDGPAEVLAAVSRLAVTAMESAMVALRKRADAFSVVSGRSCAPPDRKPRVIPWAELRSRASEADDPALERACAFAAAAADRLPALASLVAEAVRIAGLEGPTAVVGLAPPYYPRTSLEPGRDGWLIAAIGSALESMAKDGFGTIVQRPFFPGISDMSFLYPHDDEGARRLAAAACPLGVAPLPSGFSCPVINIGPWGREYHQRLERVHVSYAFGTLPELLKRVVLETFRSMK